MYLCSGTGNEQCLLNRTFFAYWLSIYEETRHNWVNAQAIAPVECLNSRLNHLAWLSSYLAVRREPILDILCRYHFECQLLSRGAEHDVSVVISLTLYSIDIFQKLSSHLTQTILDLHYRDRLFLGGVEIITIYSESHEVHKRSKYGFFFNVKAIGRCSYQFAFMC